MGMYQRAFSLTADEGGDALEQERLGIVEVVAVEWDNGTLGAAALAVADGEVGFLVVTTPGLYRPTVPLDDDVGDTTVGYGSPYTLSRELRMGIAGGTPGGVGTVTVTYRR